MNIKQRKKIIKSTFICLCICILLVNCKTHNQRIIKSIAKGILIEKDEFYFSDEADIKIAGIKYSLRSRIEYDSKGIVSKLLVYHPEGVLEYTKEDLQNDNQLLPSYGYDFENKYSYKNEKLYNKKEVLVEKIQKDILLNKQKNRVTIYYLETLLTE